ncbi:hypothetical protein MHU86_21813 [Fragilaria crotonensis]|nr:hypothetical protein MHU86_21813 [Fragilaria crotonensis]
MSQELEKMESGFAWVALFPHNNSDYSLPPVAIQYVGGYGMTGKTGTITFSSRNLPRLNSKYEAVMAISGSDPLQILAVGDAFNVLQNSASLSTEKAQYYDGELIDVSFTLSLDVVNLETSFAWIALYPQEVQNFSLSQALSEPAYWSAGSIGTFAFSSKDLPASSSKYKAVMAIRDSDPLRILGVSDAFDLLPNSANLTSSKFQYYDGEMIEVTYTLSQDANTLQNGFAWIALMLDDVHDFSLSQGYSQRTTWSSDYTGTVSLPSRSIPSISSGYRAVMAVVGTSPLRILGVSDSIYVVPNPAYLLTDKSFYFEGQFVEVTYTMNATVDVESGFASVGLFPQGVQNYTSYSATQVMLTSTGNTGTILVSTMDLPALDTTYQVVMAVTDSNPLRILGTSQPFHVAPPKKCPPGTFTEDCLPLVAIDSLFPSGGIGTGGFVVRVNGFNFGNSSTDDLSCLFGDIKVNGTYKSNTELECVAPDAYLAGVIGRYNAVVMFSVTIGDQVSFNSVPFEFFIVCKRDLCVNGYCTVTRCVCDSGFRGESCDTAVVPPRVRAATNLQVEVKKKVSYLATIEEGDAPISWSFYANPPLDGGSMNSSSGLLEWRAVKAPVNAYDVTIFAENSAGSDSSTFRLEVLSEYIIDGVKSEVKVISSGPPVPVIPIEGYCRFRENRSAVPSCQVEVFVMKDGFKRVIPAVAGRDGMVRVPFAVSEEEGGTFYLGGQPKGFLNDTIQQSFSRVGMTLNPRNIRVIGLTLQQTQESIMIKSLSDEVTLGNLSVSIRSPIPAEIKSLDIQLNSTVLSPGSEIVAYLYVVASLPGTFYFDYEVYSNTTAYAIGRLSMRFRNPTPQLVANPPSIVLQAARGARSNAQITLKNAGGAPTGDLRVVMPPDFHLLQLVSNAFISSIVPGQGVTILLSSLPNATEPFQPWMGSLSIQSAITSLNVDFRIEVVSDLVGNLIVVTEDEATFHTESKRPLNTSSVTIKNAVTLETFQQAANATGTVKFANVPRGLYEIRATADKHGEFRKLVEVSGVDTVIHAFLPLQVVSYSWSVNKISLEEEYEVIIESDFTNFVPAPVIVVEPNEINVDALIPGESQINFKITNYGFIAADNLFLNLPATNGLQFVPLLNSSMGRLPANSTVYYPVKVEKMANWGPRLDGEPDPCIGGADLLWIIDEWIWEKFTYEFEFPDEGRRLPVITVYPLPPLPPVEVGCGCAAEVAKCIWSLLPIDDCPKAIGNAAIAALEVKVNDTESILALGEALLDVFKSCVKTKQVKSKGKDVTKKVAKVAEARPRTEPITQLGGAGTEFALGLSQSNTELIGSDKIQRNLLRPILILLTALAFGIEHFDDLKNCYEGISEECIDRSGSSRLLLQVDNEVAIAQANSVRSNEALAVCIELAFFVFGGSTFFDSLESEEEFKLFDAVFKSSIDSSKDMGSFISDDEQTSLSTIRPSSDLIYGEKLRAFVAKWNRSLDYYSRGYFEPSDVPSGLDPDMINVTYIEEKAAIVREATHAAFLRGFDDIYDLWLDDQRALEEAYSRADSGVCASVRVQIKQRAVLTRDAFEAELQVQNSGLDMTNIRITLTITNRDTSEYANDMFVLSSPTLVGITGVDGNGTLAGSISGSASWLILALSNAAPKVSTYFNIGGKFEYYQDGLLTTSVMYPDTILVSPDPRLDLLYFHEYDIFGDDPFTPEVEPSVPYKLAVLVKNSGYGDAQGLRILSGVPEIIDNEKGLLIDFKIISAELAGQPSEPSFDVNFGTIPAMSSAVGIWTLTSSVQGTFSNFNATFAYKGPLDDDRLALIKSVQIFKLSHCVSIDPAAAASGGGTYDSLPDFLINKLPDIDLVPDTLISSDQGNEYPVFATVGGTIIKSETVVGESFIHRIVVNMSLPYVPMDLASPNGNWFYFRFDDILSPSYRLQSVLREGDKREVLVGQNVWRTSKTRRLIGVGEVPQRYFHILDYGPPSGVYELRFDSVGMVSKLQASNIADTTVMLTWDPMEHLAFFAVYQKLASEESGKYNLVASNVQGTSFFVTSLQPGTAYSFQIRTALDPGGYGSSGSELTLSTSDSSHPTALPTTLMPTIVLPSPESTILSPTPIPTNPQLPTLSLTSQPPTFAPTSTPGIPEQTTPHPTILPTTLQPSLQPPPPTTVQPAVMPSTIPSTLLPTTLAPIPMPTLVPTTIQPPSHPATLAPIPVPSTMHVPTLNPTPAQSTMHVPTLAPTPVPSIMHAPTLGPTPVPSTVNGPALGPTPVPSTLHVPTLAPTPVPSTVNGPVLAQLQLLCHRLCMSLLSLQLLCHRP